MPLVILLVWQAACVGGLVPARVLPAPSDVALAGWKLLLSGELARNIWVSFWRASAGFVIGGTTSKTVLVRASGPALACWRSPTMMGPTILTPGAPWKCSNAMA